MHRLAGFGGPGEAVLAHRQNRLSRSILEAVWVRAAAAILDYTKVDL
jgi:hypothetical protein